VALCIVSLSIVATAVEEDRNTTEVSPGFEWRYLASTPHGVGGHFAGVHNDALIIAGGTNWEANAAADGGKTKVWMDTTYVLTPSSTQWLKATPLATPAAYGASASFPGGVVCVGGAGEQTHHAEAFVLGWSNQKLTQTPLPALPTTNAYGPGVILDSVMYVFGALESAGGTKASLSFWSLDLDNIRAGWSALDPWPGPARILPVAVSTENALYLFSGRTLSQDGLSASNYLVDAYRYTPGNGWETMPNLPKPAAAGTAAFYGDAIYIFSGDDGRSGERQSDADEVDGKFSPDVMRFDLQTNTWSYAGTIPHSYVTTQVLNWQNEIVVLPGEPDSDKNRGRRVMIGRME
jgi:N-acetylneuraminic acid mutarotase